jgi:hypothetical protein
MAQKPTIQSSSDARPKRVTFFTTRNLSVLVTGAVIIVGLFRADTKDIPKIFETLFESHPGCALGWIIAVVILVAAIILIRIVMRIDGKEIDRLAKERDELQKRLLDK